MAEKNLTLPVYTLEGKEQGTIILAGSVFGIEEANEQVVHDAVVTEQANARQATAKTKKRHEVSGGGKKPYRQKGTGRARAGSSRSPIWVGGGTVFGPDGNQNYKLSQNKKEHALALKTVLSGKAKENLVIVHDYELKGISSKKFAEALKAVKAEGKILLVGDLSDEKFLKSARNLANVQLRAPENVSVIDVLYCDKIVSDVNSIKVIEGGLR